MKYEWFVIDIIVNIYDILKLIGKFKIEFSNVIINALTKLNMSDKYSIVLSIFKEWKFAISNVDIEENVNMI